MRKFICSVCGYVYDEAAGVPEKGVTPGTVWEDLSADFICPVCAASKSVFKPFDIAVPAQTSAVEDVHVENIRELSAGEISVICANLAKGCEKQRFLTEMDAFNKLADYYKSKTVLLM